MKFQERKIHFPILCSMGHTSGIILVIFAEVFCALLLTAGLLSGFAAWIPVMLFIVIIFFVHKTDPVKEKEDTILFLLAFLTILLCGPGKWSLDKLIGK